DNYTITQGSTVPEPAGAALLLLGGGALMLRRRRRFSRRACSPHSSSNLNTASKLAGYTGTHRVATTLAISTIALLALSSTTRAATTHVWAAGLTDNWSDPF